MRRRILLAIVGVTIVATVVLTVPLALISSRRARDDSGRELDRIAQRAAVGISTTGDLGADSVELPSVEANIDLGVYLPDGTRIAGSGPKRADEVVQGAALETTDGIVGDKRVLAHPLVVNEQKVGVIRVAEPVSDTSDRVQRDLLILLGFDVAAVAVAAGVGWFVAARLVRPLRSIRDDAVRLGNGDFSVAPERSGVSELDETADALAETATRLDSILRREREFSSNASHQLRTPLTALRLSIESELATPRPDPSAALDEALIEIDRLEATIATLLDLARDAPIERGALDMERWVGGVSDRWNGILAARGRPLRCSVASHILVHVSRDVLDQVLDVLIGNAVEHGAGPVTVGVADDGANLAVTVSDTGRLGRDPSELFVRRDPAAAGRGVGLALARSLAEAEGGRLVVGAVSPTTFRLLLPDLTMRPGVGDPLSVVNL
jgi:signal transduction histidine kinase